MSKSGLEDMFYAACFAARLPLPRREYRFLPNRRWRFDFAWPDEKLAVEIEGGEFVKGRHNRGQGMISDCEKYNAATIEGWRLLRFTGKMISYDMANCIRLVSDALTQKIE